MRFLANVSCSLYAIARPSVVCRLSVTLARPTEAVEIFGNISSLRHLVPWPSIVIQIHKKFYGDVPWEPIRRGS